MKSSRTHTPARHAAPSRLPRVAALSGALIAAAAAGGIMLSQVGGLQAANASSTRNVANLAMVDDNRASRSQARPVVSPSTAPSQATASPATSAPASSPSSVPAPPAATPPSSKVVDYQYQAQINYYYCGPAATRIALTATGHTPTQDQVASLLHTTTSGTDSANDTTRGLNSVLGGNVYQTREIPAYPATPAQADQLQADVVRAVSSGRAVVANIVHSVTDTAGVRHTYDGGHFLTIVGYQDGGRTVRIADPANPNDPAYWVATADMANWIATHGYSY